MPANNINHRPGLFTTHRGRKVKYGAAVALSASFAMMIAVNALGDSSGDTGSVVAGQGGAEESASPAAGGVSSGGVTSGPQQPAVAAAVADPFRPYAGVNAAAEQQSGEGGDPSTSSSAPVPQSSTSAHTNLLASAQRAAVPLATYSYQQTPQVWAQSVPGVSAALAADLKASAVRRWSLLQRDGVSTRAALVTSAAPKFVAFDDEAGTAQVAVTVVQDVTMDDQASTRVVTSVFHLSRVDEDSDGQWLVVGITA